MSIGLNEVVEASTGGRARRNAKQFSPNTQGGPLDSRRVGDDWETRGMSGEWTRWRRVGPDLWEVAG